MLVLNRRTNEKIAIQGNVTLTVVSIEGGRVRLGIDAPEDVPIVRGELSFWLEQPGRPPRGESDDQGPHQRG